jgi:hypothetical protein
MLSSGNDPFKILCKFTVKGKHTSREFENKVMMRIFGPKRE